MNKTEIQDKFKKDGWCVFPIKLINESFHNFTSEHLKCNEEKNFQSLMREFRLDYDSDSIVPGQDRFDPNREFNVSSLGYDFTAANKEKEKLYEKVKEDSISQLWFYNNTDGDIDEFLELDAINTIKNSLTNILKYLYDYDDSVEIDHNELQLTLYNKNCRFTPHKDNPESEYICAITIYLNENYNKDNGGLLFLDGESITPELGTCAVMDLQTHVIEHGVTEVTGEVGRFAFISFPTFKGQKVVGIY